MPAPSPAVLVLTGPTAAGKGALARALALRLGAELIAMDALKVYRRMDVGTAKPDAAARATVAHHGLDRVEPWEPYSVGRWVADTTATLLDLAARGRTAILVGGTGLYLRACVRGLAPAPPRAEAVRARLIAEAGALGAPALHARLRTADPVAAARLHVNDTRRVVRALEVFEVTGRSLSAWHADTHPLTPGAVVVECVRDPADLRVRIAWRTGEMLARGLVAEVAALRADPRGLAPEPAAAVGYREIAAHLDGPGDLVQARAAIERHTWRLTGRQRAWVRAVPSRVVLPIPPGEPAETSAARLLAGLAPG